MKGSLVKPVAEETHTSTYDNYSRCEINSVLVKVNFTLQKTRAEALYFILLYLENEEILNVAIQ